MTDDTITDSDDTTTDSDDTITDSDDTITDSNDATTSISIETKVDYTDSQIVTALDDHAAPLSTTDPTTDTDDPVADTDDLAYFDDLFEDGQIVGLGEATHGTREFFQLKHRLIQYLVVEHDVRVVGIETGFANSLSINDYVVHGEGDPAEALRGIEIWPWKAESVLNLIEWLREFNTDRPLKDRVRFYGFDAQYTQGAVAELREFFERADPEFLASVDEDLDAVDDDGVPAHTDDDCRSKAEATELVVPTIRERLEANCSAYMNATSERDWELARHHVEILEQVAEHKRAHHALGEVCDPMSIGDEPLTDEQAARMKRVGRVRDRAMADNVEWLLDRGHSSRIALWAHDGHVSRTEQPARRIDISQTSMGGYLAEWYGDEYCAVGFSFGSGEFRAMGETDDGFELREWSVDGPLPDTIDATLAALGYSLAAVNLRTATADDALREWLSTPRRHFALGAVYDPVDREQFVVEHRYPEVFDAVVYVDETTSTRLLID